MSKYLREEDVVEAIQEAIGDWCGPERKMFDIAMRSVFAELDKVERHSDLVPMCDSLKQFGRCSA